MSLPSLQCFVYVVDAQSDIKEEIVIININISIGALLRAFTFHECGTGSIARLSAVCGLSLLILYRLCS